MTTPISMPIPVSKVLPNPNQPRTTFNEEAITELAESIQENDLLQPILVEDNQNGTFTLVGGERRLRAFQSLGRETIPAQVRQKSNHGGRELLLHAVIENVQREEMSPLDEAAAYQRLHLEFGMAWDEISKRVGKHSTAIQSRIILLKLDQDIQGLIRSEKLTPNAEVARALLGIPNSKERVMAAHKIVETRLTVKQAIAAAKHFAEITKSNRLEIGKAKSPAMRLAQSKSKQDFDEQTSPKGWNALKQAGQVPPWAMVSEKVTQTCKRCSLSEHANETVCRECPLVDFLTMLVGGCHE
jgi:ParB family chromosome partitioning protein